LEDLKNANHQLALGCTIETPRFRSQLDAVERVSRRSNGKYGGYIPIRFVPNEKLSTHDKLLLAFDALTLGEALGNTPPFGKIIHGAQHRITKITLATLFVTVRSLINKILSQAETHQPPQLVLNKHCAECEFNFRCRQIAEEKGDLSLLSRMSNLEREKLHERGIFLDSAAKLCIQTKAKTQTLRAHSSQTVSCAKGAGNTRTEDPRNRTTGIEHEWKPYLLGCGGGP
jgi:predicted RecB family nuclease